MTPNLFRGIKKDNSKKHPARDQARREIKLAAVVERRSLSAKKSARQRLADLDERFGKGNGAVAERVRLTAKMLKEEAPKFAVLAAPAKTPSCIPELTAAVEKKRAKERRDATRAFQRPGSKPYPSGDWER